MSSMPSDLPKLICLVAEYYDADLPEGTLSLWEAGLKKFSPDEIKTAFGVWINREDRMPKISNIVQILNGSDEDLALAALVKVEEGMRLHGGYATVVFDDPVIHAVIGQLGGWIRLCSLTEEKFVWWKKDFLERYRHHLRTGLRLEDVSPKLFGIFDQANLPLRMKAQKPAVIGDFKKAVGWTAKIELEDRKVQTLIEKSLNNKSFH